MYTEEMESEGVDWILRPQKRFYSRIFFENGNKHRGSMKGGKYIQRPVSSIEGLCSMKFSFVYYPKLNFFYFKVGISVI